MFKYPAEIFKIARESSEKGQTLIKVKNKPLVTVLTVAYNPKSSYLKEAVISALNQDYPNLEVLIVDDGSKHDLENILEEIKHPRKKCIRLEHMEHKGLPYPRILGVERALGDYIAVLDSDDSLTEGSIAKREKIFEEKDVGIVYGDVNIIDKIGKSKYEEHFDDYLKSNDFNKAIILNWLGPVKHSGVMFKKDAVLDVGNYNPKIDVDEDDDLIMSIAKKYGHCHIPEIVVNHRDNPDSYTHSFSIRYKFLKTRLRMVDKHIDCSFLERIKYKTMVFYRCGSKMIVRKKYKFLMKLLKNR